MVQAITGHSGALAGRSISYYSMKLTLSLQTTILLSGEEGGDMVALRKKKIKLAWKKEESRDKGAKEEAYSIEQ